MYIASRMCVCTTDTDTKTVFPHTIQEAEPLVNFLEYNPLFHPAIMQVFGKTLVCRSIDLCSHFAKTANLDCITPEGELVGIKYLTHISSRIFLCLFSILAVIFDACLLAHTMSTCVGDQVARKGTLTGGYYDPNRSRLRVQHEIYKLRKTLESTEAEKAQIQEEVEHILHIHTNIHACIHTYIHTYLHTCIHTYNACCCKCRSAQISLTVEHDWMARLPEYLVMSKSWRLNESS